MSRSTPWLLIGATFSVALVAGVALSLASDNWLVLPVALAVHALASLFFTALMGRALDEQSKPDPMTEAKIEDREGVRSERAAEDPADKPHEANPTI